MIPAGALTAQAQAALTLAVAACGADAPARRYIGSGAEADTAWDCEQLVVSLTTATPMRGEVALAGRTRSPNHPGKTPMLELRIVVELVKDYPVSEQPTDPPLLTGAATMIHTLGTSLWNVFMSAAADGSLAPDPLTLAAYRVEALNFTGPQGGLTACRFICFVTLV